jgi:uncharacterized membrane protein
MIADNPRSTAKIAGHPIHPMLVSIPIACFVGTLVTDIAYAVTTDMKWADMSAWLLTVGLFVSVLVVLAGLADFLGDRRVRKLKAAWLHGLGNGLALALSIVNVFVHSRDAYTSVVPTGLILSAVVVLILGFTAWQGGTLVFRHGVGVRPEPRA